MLFDLLFIMVVAAAAALFSEDDYQKKAANIDKITKQLEKAKETVGSDKSSKKKVDQLQKLLEEAKQAMVRAKMKSMFVTSMGMISLVSYVNTSFDGIVVAKLPFTPFGFVQGLSHRGLMGHDYTDCAALFWYILCSMNLRTVIQKVLGTEQPAVNFSSLLTTCRCRVSFPIRMSGSPVEQPEGTLAQTFFAV